MNHISTPTSSEFDVFKEFLQKIVESPTIKVLAGFFLWFLRLMYGPVFRPAYGAVAMLFIGDTITGYSYARMNPEITPNSRKMFHGLIKILIYAGLLFIGNQVSVVRFGSLLQSTVEMMIVITEGISILENIKKIANLKGLDIPFLNILILLFRGKLDEIDKKGGV